MNNVLITAVVTINQDVVDYWNNLKIDIKSAIVDKDDKQMVKDAIALIKNTEKAIHDKVYNSDDIYRNSERQAEFAAENSVCGFDYY